MSPHLLQALQLLDADTARLPTQGDELRSFSELAFETQFGFFVDWRVTNFAAIESLMARFAREIPIDLTYRGHDCELLIERDGVEERTLIADIDALDRDTAIATFVGHLPTPFVALRLLQFDPSDAAHYVIADQERAEAVLRLVGAEASRLFKILPSP